MSFTSPIDTNVYKHRSINQDPRDAVQGTEASKRLALCESSPGDLHGSARFLAQRCYFPAEIRYRIDIEHGENTPLINF